MVDSLGNVYVFDATGASPYGGGPPAPIGNVGPDAYTTPAIGDVDGDRDLDIVVVGNGMTGDQPTLEVHAWDGGTGTALGNAGEAWFSRTGLRSSGAVPVLTPFGADSPAVVATSRVDSASGQSSILFIEQPSGGAPTATGVMVDGDLAAPPLVFTGDDPTSVGGVWSVVATIDDEGRSRFFEVWPRLGLVIELDRDRAALQNGVRVLVTGDLEGDGGLELIASDDHGRIEVYRYPRTPPASQADIEANVPRLTGVEGWPFALGLGVAHEVSLADIDADQRVEVLVAAYDGRVYALNFNGTPQLGFPVITDFVDRPIPDLVSAPLTMQLVGDDVEELIVGSGDGRLFVIDGRGQSIDELVMPGPADHAPTPIVADLDGNGRVDVVVPSDTGENSMAMVFELPVAEGASSWPAYRGGNARLGRAVATGGGTPAPSASELMTDVYVYPNPVKGEVANIHFSLHADASIKVRVLDAIGRIVAEPAVRAAAPGQTQHVVAWSVADQASGLYVLSIDASGGGRSETRHLTFAVTR